MHVTVDRQVCALHGVCESLAGDVFSINSHGELELTQDAIPAEAEQNVRDAVAQCPSGALSLVQ